MSYKEKLNQNQRKYQITKFTLATLSLGVLIVPVQSPVGHATRELPEDGQTSVQAELHPHHSDHGSWHGHYINPRSLRAVGHGDGKDTKIDADANWRFYETMRA